VTSVETTRTSNARSRLPRSFGSPCIWVQANGPRVTDPVAVADSAGQSVRDTRDQQESEMSVNSAFGDYQDTIDEDPDVVAVARGRRGLVKTAFGGEDDVTENFSSGSLRRATQLKPIHDLDMVVVYDADAHPTRGQDGDSAEDALVHVQGRVNTLLGYTNGTSSNLVRLAKVRNHSVKCFIDAPDSGFTVDVMPALRQADGTLLIPEKLSRKWVPADPEYLIRQVQDRHDTWKHYRPMVRVLKDWRLDAAVNMSSDVKSLVIEVLALTCLPTSGTRAQALAKFFEAAIDATYQPICDPANLCGEVQPDLDYIGLRAELEKAAEHASNAVLCEQVNDIANAKRLWRKVFGDDFPAPDGEPTLGAGAAAAGAAATGLGYQPVKDSPQG